MTYARTPRPVSIKIMQEVLHYAPETLTPAEKFVLLAIAYDARDHDRIARFSSAGTVAAMTNLNPSSVRRVLAELVARALLQRIGGKAYKGRIQQYRVTQLHAHHAAHSATPGSAMGAGKRNPTERTRPVDKPRDDPP